MRNSTVPVSRVGARLPQAPSPGDRVGTRYPPRRLRAAVPWLRSRWAGARFGSTTTLEPTSWRICRPGPNPRRCFTSPCSPSTSQPRSPHPRHPQRGTLAAVEPSTCPDGAATKAARLTRNSTATLTWCSCCIQPARPRAPAFLASEAFSYVTGTGLGELGLTRYRLFHARLGSMSCKPFGGEIRSEDPATRPTRVTTAAVR
jgi:hypothetical protein